MLDTLTMEFPKVEDEEAKSADKKHDHQEGVCHTHHDIKSKGKKNWHVIHLKFMYFFKPPFNDSIIF